MTTPTTPTAAGLKAAMEFDPSETIARIKAEVETDELVIRAQRILDGDPICYKCGCRSSEHTFAGCEGKNGECGCPMLSGEVNEYHYIARLKNSLRQAVAMLEAGRTENESVYNALLDEWTKLLAQDPYEVAS